jgi:hypothetical protein
MLAAAARTDRTVDDGGFDMRSRGEGERNEQLGNDHAEQNTGRGPTSERIEARNPPTNDDTPQN